MLYTSTRDSRLSVSASQAIAGGLSKDGGLMLPVGIPAVSEEFILSLADMSYPKRASLILSLFLTDFPANLLDVYCEDAYKPSSFENSHPAPLACLSERLFLLELWHGPTCAFKDMALQLMPRLLSHAVRAQKTADEVLILVATSGDTGKAALEGFADVEGVKIAVFYPDNAVSPMQALQMATQEGDNLSVFAVRGNFDDAQSRVKKIFSDKETADWLKQRNIVLSSANSINWGRLVPQIVYYFSAYVDLLKYKKVAPMDPINVVVPTGNFGNILAAYYAKSMGLPIARLICASNKNNVLSDFFKSGIYDANREFYMTCSPSMDILVSSNLERLLYEACGRDDRALRRLMMSLNKNNKFTVSDGIREWLEGHFWADWIGEPDCKNVIADTFNRFGYAVDPHTAVALGVYKRYLENTADYTPSLIVSTASIYKFPDTVLSALGADVDRDGFEQLEALSRITNTPIPKSLSQLKSKKIRHSQVLELDAMKKAVLDIACPPGEQ